MSDKAYQFPEAAFDTVYDTVCPSVMVILVGDPVGVIGEVQVTVLVEHPLLSVLPVAWAVADSMPLLYNVPAGTGMLQVVDEVIDCEPISAPSWYNRIVPVKVAAMVPETVVLASV